MKWLITVIFLFAAALSLYSEDYRAGDRVEVLYQGSWYPAVVLKAAPDAWLIHYTDYDSSWDESVDSSRLRRPAAAESEQAAPEEAVPVQKYYDPRTIYIRQKGRITAIIEGNGGVIRKGKTIGKIDASGYVYKNGKENGYIDARGRIRIGGRYVGYYNENQEIRKGDKTIGRIEYGVITLNGREWGTEANYNGEEPDTERAALYLIFFVPEFGFVK